MADAIEEDVGWQLRAMAYRARLEIERAADPAAARRGQMLRLAARVLGCAALGLLAAGLAIFAIAILINLVFHFSPS